MSRRTTQAQSYSEEKVSAKAFAPEPGGKTTVLVNVPSAGPQALQRTVGNQAVGHLLKTLGSRDSMPKALNDKRVLRDSQLQSFLDFSTAQPAWPVQTKRAWPAPGDSLEQEAEQVASRVLDQSESPWRPTCSCGGTCPKCAANARRPVAVPTSPLLQTEAGPSAATFLAQQALRSPGRPLDLATREFMEAEFGHDFQDVRIHTGPAADKSNQELGAQAFTTGTDIVFAAGRYAPEQPASQHLLAHELTHVLQQRERLLWAMWAGSAKDPRVPSSVRESPERGACRHFQGSSWARSCSVFSAVCLRRYGTRSTIGGPLPLPRYEPGEPGSFIVYSVSGNKNLKALQTAAEELDRQFAFGYT